MVLKFYLKFDKVRKIDTKDPQDKAIKEFENLTVKLDEGAVSFAVFRLNWIKLVAKYTKHEKCKLTDAYWDVSSRKTNMATYNNGTIKKNAK